MINVLVVDDSAFMRKALSMMLDKQDDISVIDTARDGKQALEKVERLDPDVVTMDVEMPRMDGITALKRIMKDMPRPVIMVSSLTKEGAETTVEALEAGAVDFIPKDHSRVSLKITEIEEDLARKIRSAASANMRMLQRASRRKKRRSRAGSGSTARADKAKPKSRRERAKTGSGDFTYRRARLLAIGVSTGGPFALQKVIPHLPENFPLPVVIVQHMPPHFTGSLARRLNDMSPLNVVEAEDGMPIETGTVYIAPGGKHFVFKTGHQMRVSTPDEPEDVLHRPSVNVMFESAADAYNGRVLGAVLTGMGKDGCEGARHIVSKGGKIIAQDEDTCVVYGMPRAVVEAELADAVFPLNEMAGAISHALGVEALEAS